MFTKIITILAAGLLLGGCAANQSQNEKRPDVLNNLEFSVVKLYAKTNLDSGEILDSINKDLKAGKTIEETLQPHGTYFTDVKYDFDLDSNRSVDFQSTNTTSHVAGINTNGTLIPGYYNTGVKGNFKIVKLDTGRYVFTYSIKNATLKRIETSPSNKIVTIPEVASKDFEQTVIVEDGLRSATGISNPEPKQYELFVIKITQKKDSK